MSPTNETREDRATQPMDAGWLGFVTKIILQISKEHLDIFEQKGIDLYRQFRQSKPWPPSGGSRQRTL